MYYLLTVQTQIYRSVSHIFVDFVSITALYMKNGSDSKVHRKVTILLEERKDKFSEAHFEVNKNQRTCISTVEGIAGTSHICCTADYLVMTVCRCNRTDPPRKMHDHSTLLDIM